MMSGNADGRAWWQARPVPIPMTGFWVLPSWAIYFLITGVTRRPGPSNRDRGHRGDGARRILGGRWAHLETAPVRAGGSVTSVPRATAVAAGPVTA